MSESILVPSGERGGLDVGMYDIMVVLYHVIILYFIF